MKKTGYLHDNRYLLHDTGPYHPEMAERLTAVYNGIKEAGLLDQLVLLPAVRADLKWIETVHDSKYIRRFEEVCLSGNRTFDYPDNQMCVDTYETAFLAAGGVVDVTRRVMEGELDNAFCAVRPPGHHAERDQAMGFEYDLANAFAEYIGVRLTVQLADDWQEMLQKLDKTPTGFIAAGMLLPASQTDHATLSDGYLPSRQLIVVHRNNREIRQPEDLAGQNVHIQKGSIYQESLEALKAGGIEVQIVSCEDI